MPMRKRESGAPHVDVDQLYRRTNKGQAPTAEPSTTERLTRRIEGEYAATEAADRSLRGETGRARVNTTTPLLLAAGALVLGGNAVLGGGDEKSTERSLAPEAKIGQVYAEPVDTARASIAAGASELIKQAKLDELNAIERPAGQSPQQGGDFPTEDGPADGMLESEPFMYDGTEFYESPTAQAQPAEGETTAAGITTASEEAIRTAQQQERFNGQP